MNKQYPNCLSHGSHEARIVRLEGDADRLIGSMNKLSDKMDDNFKRLEQKVDNNRKEVDEKITKILYKVGMMIGLISGAITAVTEIFVA